MTDVIVLGTVLEEARGAAQAPRLAAPHVPSLTHAAPQVRRRNASAHARLRSLAATPSRRVFVFANEHHRETFVATAAGESPNDRNDRAIRAATAFYARVCPGVRVLLLTADAANRAAARAEGIEARRRRVSAARLLAARSRARAHTHVRRR